MDGRFREGNFAPRTTDKSAEAEVLAWMPAVQGNACQILLTLDPANSRWARLVCQSQESCGGAMHSMPIRQSTVGLPYHHERITDQLNIIQAQGLRQFE